MRNPFKKQPKVEKKSSFIGSIPFLINGGNGENTTMTIKRALDFYDNAAPVATAIDWINDEFKTLPVVLKSGDDVEKEADILKFLQSPNDDMTQEDFLENLGAYFLITNECYLMATGNVNRPPAELMVISPEHVVVKKDKDGFISQMRVQIVGMTEKIFNRSDNSYRFYNAEKDAELWQIKGFSAIGDSHYGNTGVEGISNLGNARGRSKLSSIHREINQYIQIATSNLATLDNGMKPSGTLSMPEGLTLDDDQFEKLREQVTNFYSSAKNSGKVLILDNGMTFTPASLLPKDMDFKELSRNTTITIFNRYKVPLPLISPDNMTLANMGTAKLNLFDNCVIPIANRLLRELSSFLGERFGLDENTYLCPDLSNVAALQIRYFEQLKMKKDLDLYTVNELRGEVGLEEIEGGDTLYQQSNLIPIGTEQVPPINNNQENMARSEFEKLMALQLDKKGNRLLSDDEIKEIADLENLN